MLPAQFPRPATTRTHAWQSSRHGSDCSDDSSDHSERPITTTAQRPLKRRFWSDIAAISIAISHWIGDRALGSSWSLQPRPAAPARRNRARDCSTPSRRIADIRRCSRPRRRTVFQLTNRCGSRALRVSRPLMIGDERVQGFGKAQPFAGSITRPQTWLGPRPLRSAGRNSSHGQRRARSCWSETTTPLRGLRAVNRADQAFIGSVAPL